MTLLTLLAPTTAQQTIPPWFDTGVNVAVEVAFGCGPLDRVKLWQDVTAWVSAVSTGAGRSEELDRFQPGSASVTFRFAEREFDPEYPDGPWYGSLLPNVPIRVRAQYTVDGVLTDHWLFTGTVDEWPLDFSYGQAEITVPCTDALGVLGAIGIASTPFEQELAVDIAAGAGPTSWYQLAESAGTVAVDRIGGLDGTYTGNPTLGSAPVVSGSPDTAVNFTTGSYLSLPTGVVTGLPWAVEFTFDASSLVNHGGLFEMKNGSYGATLEEFDYGAPYGSTLRADWTAATMVARRTTWDVDFDDGTARHYVFGVDSTGVPFLYVDGTLASSVADTTPGELVKWTTPSAVTFAYGTRIDTLTGEGTYSDLVVWNGVLPSAERIAARASAAITGWPVETTAERAERILDATGWPTRERVVGTGSSNVSSGVTGGMVLDYLMRLNDTEAGQCYADGRGRIIFRGRTDLTGDARTVTSQAVFGDR